ncbi:hypothetical protein D9Q98_003972 [Chlorella vulgaris]|uniref:Uncharacterized protein n=1 Tax=Chlorella vulgaris TaxID=3077 RepID=A0A9D4TQU0_CHLVU|nr:hypothetical protein D9Q98_003972 [Chlorella vulgaris]
MSALRLASTAARRLDGLESRQHPRISSLRGVNQPPPHILACRAWRDGQDAAGDRAAPLEKDSLPLATSSRGSPTRPPTHALVPLGPTSTPRTGMWRGVEADEHGQLVSLPGHGPGKP